MDKKEARKLTLKKYRLSEKYKITQAKYNKTQKGKDNKNRWRDKNRDKVNKYAMDKYYRDPKKNISFSKRYQALNKKSLIDSRLKRIYGISLDIYNDIFNLQNGMCGICKIHQSELNKSLCVDHCHVTGRVRGLLCNKCNQGLGLFKDNKDNIKNALNWIS